MSKSAIDNLDAGHQRLKADAERYRYLRDRAGNAILDELAAESRPAQWDAIVDEYRGVQMGDGSARKPEAK